MFVAPNIGKLVSLTTSYAQRQLSTPVPVISRICCGDWKCLTSYRRKIYGAVNCRSRVYCCSSAQPSESTQPTTAPNSLLVNEKAPIFVNRVKELAEKAAVDLSLTIQKVRWSGGKLVVFIGHIDSERNPSVGDCSALSRSLGRLLDEEDVIPSSYQLEVSSPGLSEVLSTDKDFAVFRGFPVRVTTNEEHKGKKEFVGRLAGHSLDVIRVNCSGKMTKIPRGLVKQVVLIESSKD